MFLLQSDSHEGSDSLLRYRSIIWHRSFEVGTSVEEQRKAKVVWTLPLCKKQNCRKISKRGVKQTQRGARSCACNIEYCYHCMSWRHPTTVIQHPTHPHPTPNSSPFSHCVFSLVFPSCFWEPMLNVDSDGFLKRGENIVFGVRIPHLSDSAPRRRSHF
jgi:hypothetical protein